VLYDEAWPALEDWAWCVGSAAVVLFVGWRVFKRFEPRLAEEL
jgi:ABC-type polysaccharide/polyol phosphate export permease